TIPSGDYAVAFTRDGKSLVTCTVGFDWSSGEVAVWDADTGQPQRVFYGGCPFQALALRPDGRRAAAAGTHGGVWVFDLDAGAPGRPVPLKGGGPPLRPSGPVAQSRDGRFLAFGEPEDGGVDVALLDVPAGTVRKLVGHAHHLEGLAFRPDGGRLVTY